MKYHINDDYEVKPCSATVDGRCPFWGKHNGDNHYNSENDAIEAIETILSKKHTFSFKKKHMQDAQFIKHREETRKNLINYANVDESELTPVSNVDEMVKQWFSGDRNKYDSFQETATNNNLKDNTKQAVSGFLQKGMSVNSTKSVKDIPFENTSESLDDFDSSEITLIDDVPDKLSWDDLRSGALKAFKH